MKEFEVVEKLRGAKHDTVQGVVGNAYREAGFFADPLVEIFQQRAVSGEHETALADIGGEIFAKPKTCWKCSWLSASRDGRFIGFHIDPANSGE